MRFLRLGLSPTGRVQRPTHPSHPHPCGGLKDDGYDGECHLEAKIGKQLDKYITLTKITLLQISEKGDNGLSGVDAVLYQLD